jgi:hypothetical protein
VQTLDTAIAQQLWFVRVFGTMFVIFGGIALFLASVGLYAVMSFSVSRRIREVGIRMALGAQARDVVGMIFRQGSCSSPSAWCSASPRVRHRAAAQRRFLFQVQPRDPVIFSGVAAVLVAWECSPVWSPPAARHSSIRWWHCEPTELIVDDPTSGHSFCSMTNRASNRLNNLNNRNSARRSG